MKLVTFSFNGIERVGALLENTIVDLNHAYAALLSESGEPSPYELAQALVPSEMTQFLKKGEEAIRLANEAISFVIEKSDKGLFGEKLKYAASEVELLAPVPRPGKIVCVGLNYIDHCEETGMEPPKSPVIFSKFNNAVTGPGEAIILPTNSKQVDYEAELAFVVGKKAKRVSEQDAYSYIAGYTVVNDISARDMQFEDGQWIRGKTPDTFAPIGPVIVTKDEVEDPHKLDIKLTLNGETMQSSNTENLIFSIPFILSYLSESVTFEPGDIIATGTPPGVGMGRKPQVWLKDGDHVVVEVEKIGSLSNVVKAEN
jgi:2-keto-4-pentenoate hydratase/2-oxohepta-3-ene-1,7-dioic acid hydratase in catechol pathway